MFDLHKYKIAELLPHRPPMILIDELLAWEHEQVKTLLKIRESSLFYSGFGVPAHVGLEYMAQSCGVYAGVAALKVGDPIRMGFLLSTRNYYCEVSWFKAGDILTITAKEVLRQEAMAVFDCTITLSGKEVAAAQLTVYQSDEIVEVT